MIPRTQLDGLPACDSRRSGHAIIEISMAMPFLVGLLLGIWQFGYSFYNYAKLEQAVRAGARYASVALYDSASSTPSLAFQTAVQNMVVYGSPSPAAGTKAVALNLSTSNVVVTPTFTSGVPTAMTVAINNYQMPTYFSSMTLSNKPAAWFPYVGTFGPP